MKYLAIIVLTLFFSLPQAALAKRVALPSMFFDMPDSWTMAKLDAANLPKNAEGVIVKPSANASYSVSFIVLPKNEAQKRYYEPLKSIDKQYVIRGSMLFAGQKVPSVFWSENSNAAKYLLQIPSKSDNDVFIMYIVMNEGTQEQWDKWSAEAEKMLRSLHRKR